MKKKTMGILLTILMISVYGISVNAQKGGNPLDVIWDYINSVINPKLEDHENRITALEPLEHLVRIGVTSGSPEAITYEQVLAVATIAEADINQYVENLPLDITFEFVVKNNQVGGAIYNTILFKEDGIDLIVGHPYSGQCMESLNYVERKNMVLISGSSTSPLLSLPDDRLFRTCLPDSAQAPALAEMWETWGAEAVLIFQVGQPWGDFLSDALKVELAEREIDVLTHIKYQPDEWNFTRKLDQANQTIAKWLEENDIETVGIQFISFNELSEIQQQAADYPNLIDIVWMTTDTGNADQILEQAGEWATKTRHFRPVMTIGETSDAYDEFEEKYMDLTGEMPGYYTATQYDAYWLLVETIIETGSTDAGVIAANLIPISQTYYGISGLLALDENGDRLTQLYDIKGFYEDDPGEYEEGTFGSYDGNTGAVSWNDSFLEETGIIRPGK